MNNVKQILTESSCLFFLLGAGMNCAGGGRTFFSSVAGTPTRSTFSPLHFLSSTPPPSVASLLQKTQRRLLAAPFIISAPSRPSCTLCCYSSDRFTVLPSIIFAGLCHLLCCSSFPAGDLVFLVSFSVLLFLKVRRHPSRTLSFLQHTLMLLPHLFITLMGSTWCHVQCVFFLTSLQNFKKL